MISVIITNYNKEKFLLKNLNSLKKSVFKNFEIILFDDVSTDNSLNIVKKFKSIKLLQNKKKKFKTPALNQINGILESLKHAKGEIICFLDSDDFFSKYKLNLIYKFFKKNKNFKSVYNFPRADKKKFIFKEKSNKNIWPTIFPTSCISIRKDIFKKIIKHLKPNYLTNLEIDARLIIFMKFYFDEYNIIKRKLTHYTHDDEGITSGIKKYSKKWWLRRKEAYEYLKYVLYLKKKKLPWSLDRLFTEIIYRVLK